MQLTQLTDFALRTLIHLGTKGEGLSTVAEIAETFAISKTHLMKVVNRLVHLGYVASERGRRGGIRLARSPAEISIGALVRDTEVSLAVVGCLAQTGFCKIERCCVLKSALQEATHAFMRTLDRYTLTDLLTPKAKLAGILLNDKPARSATMPISRRGRA